MSSSIKPKESKINEIVCIVSLGSNTDSLSSMALARKYLQRELYQLEYSTETSTQPIGLSNRTLFLNQLAYFKTTKSILELTQTFKSIEDKIGRDRTDKENILIDIDLIAYGNKILKPQDMSFNHIKEGIKELKLTI